MFKVHLRKNVEDAINYFLKDKSLSNDEKRGVWIGNGADALGVGKFVGVPRSPIFNASGRDVYGRVLVTEADPRSALSVRDAQGRALVTEADLRQVLQGYAPPSADFPGSPLNSRYVKKGRRCAWDCVLSPDKSVSIAALCLADKYLEQKTAVRSAYDAAIQETFMFMECLARRTNGHGQDIETGTLLAARFDHEVSRRNDPHLHSHLLTINTTCQPYGLVHKHWHALETIQIFRQLREIDIVFQRALAWHLRTSGFEAKIQKVDGLPVTVLPAVAPAICKRLSKAHAAILAKVGNQWKREKRDISHKRKENLFNENLRPSKKGSLIARQALTDQALSPEEMAEVATMLGPAIDLPPTPPLLPPARQVAQQILHAARQLKYYNLTPSRLTRAALVASADRLDIPFVTYWDLARRTLGSLLAEPFDTQEREDYAVAVDLYWQTELENTAIHPHQVVVSGYPEFQTEPIPPSSTFAPAQLPSAPADETRLPSATAGSASETSQPSAALPPFDPALLPYALPVEAEPPDEEQEHQSQGL